MPTIKTYFLSTRPQFLTAVALPVAIGGALSINHGFALHIANFLITLAAGILYHAGLNVLNDYFDFRNGTDNINEGALTPFTGGSRMIQEGLMSPSQTLALAILLLSAGSILGIYLAIQCGYLILILGIIGLATGALYSAPVGFLAGRGLGEITVALNFGILTVAGSYYVQTGSIAPAAVAAALPIGFLIAGLLFINEFPDYEADKRSDKRNLVVVLGPARARYGLFVLFAAAVLSLILAVALGLLPPLTIISLAGILITLPAAFKLMKSYNSGKELIPAIKLVITSHLITGILTAAILMV